MDIILQSDERLFYLINTELTGSFLDFFMTFVTTKSNFVELLALACIAIFILGRWKDRKALILVIIAALLSDFTTESLKHLIQRTRPCAALEGVRVLVGCSGSFSFPSGHATNVFAVAAYLSLTYRKYMSVFLPIAAIVAYSRVYVGVHYPLDAFGGAAVGSLMSFLMIQIDKKAAPVIIPWLKGSVKK